MRTRTFQLDKLVRDKIVQNHIDEHAEVVSRKLKKGDKIKALKAKVVEEISEGTDLSELADVQEALDQLIVENGFTKKEVATAQAEKRAKNGGFENGDYIETETWPAGHKWAEYYAADPDRFPEIISD